MNRLFKAMAVFIAVVSLHAPSQAVAGRGSADEAVAMVQRAVTYIRQHGKKAAFAAFADQENTDFHDRDLYIYVYDMQGVSLAHGNNPRMVGKNLYNLKDADGKNILQELIGIARTRGKGWADFKWPNPVSQKMESKSGYIEAVDGEMFVGCGIYK